MVIKMWNEHSVPCLANKNQLSVVRRGKERYDLKQNLARNFSEHLGRKVGDTCSRATAGEDKVDRRIVRCGATEQLSSFRNRLAQGPRAWSKIYNNICNNEQMIYYKLV